MLAIRAVQETLATVVMAITMAITMAMAMACE
jgi:hypothetical protein